MKNIRMKIITFIPLLNIMLAAVDIKFTAMYLNIHRLYLRLRAMNPFSYVSKLLTGKSQGKSQGILKIATIISITIIYKTFLKVKKPYIIPYILPINILLILNIYMYIRCIYNG